MPKTMVMAHPPMNPSTVFLGESLIRGVLPMKNPKIYAQMSFAITKDTGKKNLSKCEETIVRHCSE